MLSCMQLLAVQGSGVHLRCGLSSKLYMLQTLRAEGPRASTTVINDGLSRRQSNPQRDTKAAHFSSGDLSDYQAASQRADFDASKYKTAR